jgi:hypothetical protein
MADYSSTLLNNPIAQALRDKLRAGYNAVAEPLFGTEMDPTMLGRALPELGINPIVGHAAELAGPAAEQAAINAGNGRVAAGTPGGQAGAIRLPGDVVTPEVAQSKADMLLEKMQVPPTDVLASALRRKIQQSAGMEDALHDLPVPATLLRPEGVSSYWRNMYPGREALPEPKPNTWGAYFDRHMGYNEMPNQVRDWTSPKTIAEILESAGVPAEYAAKQAGQMQEGQLVFQPLTEVNTLNQSHGAPLDYIQKLINSGELKGNQLSNFNAMAQGASQHYAEAMRGAMNPPKELSTPQGTWVDLQSKPQVQWEGANMHHCIGGDTYCRAIKDQNMKAWSLRDESNNPLVTVNAQQKAPGQWAIDQIKGPHDRVPHEQMPAVNQLIDHIEAKYPGSTVSGSSDYKTAVQAHDSWLAAGRPPGIKASYYRNDEFGNLKKADRAHFDALFNPPPPSTPIQHNPNAPDFDPVAAGWVNPPNE